MDLWNSLVAGTRPADRMSWKLFVCVLCLVFLACVATHMQELGAWVSPELIVDGEFIQGTHDSYHWLAGAKGVGEATGTPLALMAKWFAALTGQPIGMAGFFLPPLFAGLVAVVMALWCRLLGAAEGGLVAGYLAVLAPGFYYRMRLGYYDTDMATLLFPLFLCWGMALAFAPWLRTRWDEKTPPPGTKGEGGDADEAGQDAGLVRCFLLLTGFGLFGRFGAWWHGHILSFVQVLCIMGVALAPLAGRPGARGRLLTGVGVFMAAALLGWPGLALSLLATAAAWKAPARLAPLWRSPWPALGLILALALAGGVAQKAWSSGSEFLAAYLKPAAANATAAADAVVYPGIGQSVIEAQNIPFADLLQRYHQYAGLAVLGMAGFLAVVALRPAAVFLLPFFLLSLGALKLGSRLAMFGGPPVALGLGLPLAWLLAGTFRHGSRSGLWRLGGCLAGMALLAAPMLLFYVQLPPTPVLTKTHAEALIRLKDISPPGSKVWTWWDWGYATHYYAERISFADGGRHYGHHIFPLGLALTTPSALQSSQLIKYSAGLGDEPWTVWDKMTVPQLKELLLDLGRRKQELPMDAPRYVVATFENVRLAPWITYYGTWNMLKREGTHGRVIVIRDPFSFDYDKGELVFKDGGGVIPVGTIDILSADGRKGYVYQGRNGPHCLVHLDARQYLIVDSQIYNSMLVQLLLEDPKKPRLADQFTLVHDAFPDVRVYQVK